MPNCEAACRIDPVLRIARSRSTLPGPSAISSCQKMRKREASLMNGAFLARDGMAVTDATNSGWGEAFCKPRSPRVHLRHCARSEQFFPLSPLTQPCSPIEGRGNLAVRVLIYTELAVSAEALGNAPVPGHRHIKARSADRTFVDRTARRWDR